MLVCVIHVGAFVYGRKGIARVRHSATPRNFTFWAGSDFLPLQFNQLECLQQIKPVVVAVCAGLGMCLCSGEVHQCRTESILLDWQNVSMCPWHVNKRVLLTVWMDHRCVKIWVLRINFERSPLYSTQH